ncbi:MAG TPA: hypothetical protein VKB96_18085 [Gammaproteobacteria bacterium]|nr:hypothetical protein [Gammaproteobacteria bacterium]
MSQATSRRFSAIGTLQIVIIVLAVITALVHLQRGIGFLGGGPPGGARPAGQAGPPPGGSGQGGFNIMAMLPIPLPYLFLLNGIGYLVLVTALYLPQLRQYQPVVRWLLIAFAAVTVIMYFAISGFRINPIGLLTKAVEVALIVLLLIDGRQSARAVPDMVNA